MTTRRKYWLHISSTNQATSQVNTAASPQTARNFGLEREGPVRSAVARGPVVARFTGTEVGAAGVVAAHATSVAAAGHVEQRRRRCTIGEGCRYGASVAGQGIDSSNDRGGDAGAAKDIPVGVSGAAVAVIHCDPGVRVGNGGDIGDGTAGAGGVVLPFGFGDVSRAAAAGAVPYRLAQAGAGGFQGQTGAAYCGDSVERRRYLSAVATVA